MEVNRAEVMMILAGYASISDEKIEGSNKKNGQGICLSSFGLGDFC